ncbi:MAG: hypothetical protein IKV94_05330 [Clostridia bacterium]|nr:hypothetical protein [Clostridia bacterium]
MNEEFNIPYYIFEEIVSYVEKGKKLAHWNNIRILLRMAIINNRLTKEQVEFLEKTYK